MRPLGQLESWCLAPGCCLLILNHSQIPAQPLLAAHRPSQARPLLSLRASFHLLLPFTRFPPSLLSNFSVLLSFLFLPPPIYQISPVVSNLILNLAFVIFKTSSFFPRPTDLSLPFFPISHFPSSSHLQNQNTAIFSTCHDISPFLYNLMVSTMNTI